VARALITPETPVVLGGYANRRDPMAGVRQDLFVKALALEDATGHRSVLITCDHLGLRAVNADPVCERIGAASGLARAQILLNFSHTHTGPSQAHAPDAPSYLESHQVEALYHYTRWLQDRIVETALAALADLRPARLGHATGVAGFVMNRREPTDAGIVLGHNPRGPADRSVPILRVLDPAGRMRALVFGAACHNTTIPPGDNRVHGDYAGVAQAVIEASFPGAQAMFIQGCGGDCGPYPTGSVELAEDHGRSLGGEVCRVAATGRFATIAGPLRTLLARPKLPLARLPDAAGIEAMKNSPAAWKRWVGRMLEERQRTGQPGPSHHAAPVALWQFGRDLTLVGLSGEPVVDYVALIGEELGPQRLWIAGYCNDVFGYLPSVRILSEGGYETRGLYSGEAFAPEVESVIRETVRDLSRQAGRQFAR